LFANDKPQKPFHLFPDAPEVATAENSLALPKRFRYKRIRLAERFDLVLFFWVQKTQWISVFSTVHVFHAPSGPALESESQGRLNPSFAFISATLSNRFRGQEVPLPGLLWPIIVMASLVALTTAISTPATNFAVPPSSNSLVLFTFHATVIHISTAP